MSESEVIAALKRRIDRLEDELAQAIIDRDKAIGWLELAEDCQGLSVYNGYTDVCAFCYLEPPAHSMDCPYHEIEKLLTIHKRLEND